MRKKLPPGGRLPPLEHRQNGALQRHDQRMYDDEDEDSDEDFDDDETDTRGRPRSATGGRKLPPLAMGDLGAKDGDRPRRKMITSSS